GGVVGDGVGVVGLVHAGQHFPVLLVHAASPQWPANRSSAPSLSCTPDLSTMVALASLRPMTSTSVSSRRNFTTALSSALTALMSQKWARDTSMTTLSITSLKSKPATKVSAEAKKTWPLTV